MPTCIALSIATWFGTGLIPKAPGTWGSFFAIPLCYAVVASPYSGWWPLLGTFTVVLLLGTWSVRPAEAYLRRRRDGYKKMRDRDQGQIVIDEVAGMLVATAPILWLAGSIFFELAIAFCAFRLFDIKKIWPATIFDRMKNPFGVMFDDVVAGFQAALLLVFLNLFFKV